MKKYFEYKTEHLTVMSPLQGIAFVIFSEDGIGIHYSDGNDLVINNRADQARFLDWWEYWMGEK